MPVGCFSSTKMNFSQSRRPHCLDAVPACKGIKLPNNCYVSRSLYFSDWICCCVHLAWPQWCMHGGGGMIRTTLVLCVCVCLELVVIKNPDLYYNCFQPILNRMYKYYEVQKYHEHKQDWDMLITRNAGNVFWSCKTRKFTCIWINKLTWRLTNTIWICSTKLWTANCLIVVHRYRKV